jgi:glycosyltransferase involved in cell wall biosynthesis
MICYNQKDYVRVALDSVLRERVKPNEIVIGDDASTDGTQDILRQYRDRHPEIVRLHLNEKNLGIFGNLNNVAPRATGDMVHFLSGDDWFRPALLEKMNVAIESSGLDPLKSRFILLPHYVMHNTDGSEITVKNDPKRIERFSPVGATLRGVSSTRLTGLSRALFDMWPLFPEDAASIGPWADHLQYALFAQHIDRQVVLDWEGPVYRVGVGIASKTKDLELSRSYHRSLNRILASYRNGELHLNSIDLNYLQYHEKTCRLSLDYTPLTLCNTILSGLRLAFRDSREIRYILRDFYHSHRRAVRIAGKE